MTEKSVQTEKKRKDCFGADRAYRQSRKDKQDRANKEISADKKFVDKDNREA